MGGRGKRFATSSALVPSTASSPRQRTFGLATIPSATPLPPMTSSDRRGGAPPGILDVFLVQQACRGIDVASQAEGHTWPARPQGAVQRDVAEVRVGTVRRSTGK